MTSKGFNWQIVIGFLLSLFAFASVPMVFSQWSVGSDYRWLSVGIFLISAIFLITGVRRGFAVGRGKFSKISAAILTLLSGAAFALFIFLAFFMSTWLPKSAAAPHAGQKAPDFTLTDTGGKQVSLAETVSKQKGVLLVFYRGYW